MSCSCQNKSDCCDAIDEIQSKLDAALKDVERWKDHNRQFVSEYDALDKKHGDTLAALDASELENAALQSRLDTLAGLAMQVVNEFDAIGPGDFRRCSITVTWARQVRAAITGTAVERHAPKCTGVVSLPFIGAASCVLQSGHSGDCKASSE